MINENILNTDRLLMAFRSLVIHFAYTSGDEMIYYCIHNDVNPSVCVKCLKYFDYYTDEAVCEICPKCGSKAVMSASVIEEKLKGV